MGAWGDGPFECDGGLDEAFTLLAYLCQKVAHIARGTEGDRSSLLHDGEALAANVELLRLVAEAVYRPAMFVPIRGLPLPEAEAIDGWRDEFLSRCARLAPQEFEGTLAELERFAQELAAPLSRLAELSRRQAEAGEATHLEVIAEVVADRQREAEEIGDAGTKAGGADGRSRID